MENHTKNNVQLVLRQTNALSGTPRILRRQALALANLGHQISVVSESFHPELLNHPGIKCQKVWKWPKNSLFQREFFDWQARRIGQKSKSLVIGHGDTLEQDILFLHTCVHKGAEVAPGPHNKKNLSIPFHQKIFEAGKFKTLVCNSQMMKDDIQKRFNVKAPTHIIYPGHDREIIKSMRTEVVQGLRKSMNEKIIIGVITSGNLENRGAFALLKAVGKLSPEDKNKVSVLIVGKESNPNKLYSLASELGIRNQVFWMEPRLDVANLICSVDIIVHAARIEAFGMSVLESMALSRPIIATQTVGCAEIFPDIQKDFVIEKQDADSIAALLPVLINDSALRQNMGMANQSIAEKYTWERYDQKFLAIVDTFCTQLQ